MLIPAFRLVGIPGIEVAHAMQPFTYCHILLDRHNVVLANSAPAETFSDDGADRTDRGGSHQASAPAAGNAGLRQRVGPARRASATGLLKNSANSPPDAARFK